MGVKEVVDSFFRKETNINRILYDPADVDINDDTNNLRLEFDIMKENPNGGGRLYDKIADGAGHYRECPWCVVEVTASDVQRAKAQIKSTLNYIYRNENEYAKKFREYVENKGGTLITPYFAAKKEVILMCERGHQWMTTPNSIYQSNWCPECAGNMKETTEFFRKIGEMFNCELISEYTNAKTPLTYKCPKQHKFTIKSPYWLKKTHQEIETLCPKCNMDVFAEKFQQLVKEKGGKLLTPYKGRFKPISIVCNKNHTWNTTPASVYQGSWCKFCADENHPNKERRLTAKKELLKMIESLNYKLHSEYQNNTKKVVIRCQRQHQFTMTPKYFKRLVNQNIEPCSKCRKNILHTLQE